MYIVTFIYLFIGAIRPRLETANNPIHVVNLQHLKTVLRLITCKYDLWIFPSAKASEGLPEMTSSRSMSFRPSLKSSSMFSICVPAFLRWELHHAVKVCTKAQEHHKSGECLESEPCFSDFYHNKTHFEWKTVKFNGQEGRCVCGREGGRLW